MMGRQVLVFAPAAYPLGGVAVWLDYLVRGLMQQGWVVQVGLTAGRWHDVARYQAAYPGLPVVPVPNPTGSAEGRVRTLMRIIRQMRPDLVLSANLVDVYPACQRLRRQGLPVRAVMTLHGIVADLLGDLQREATWLDAVVATNRLACKLCVTQGDLSEERVFYAPYGIDFENLSSLPRPTPATPLRILWAGRLEQTQKRTDVLPAILHHLDALAVPYHLRLVGDGPDRESLLAALQPWLQTGQVTYVGAIAAARMGPDAYAQADVFLLTSAWETGPIVVWEAMAAGLAVVSSRYVGAGLEAALQHEENCLLFAQGDAAEAAGQLARLAQGSWRQTLARAGQQLVARRYTQAHSVQAWAEALTHIQQLPLRPIPAAMRPQPAGRLDRALGVAWAETLRRWLGWRFAHASAGGEWPHTHSRGVSETDLLTRAAQLDEQAGNEQ